MMLGNVEEDQVFLVYLTHIHYQQPTSKTAQQEALLYHVFHGWIQTSQF